MGVLFVSYKTQYPGSLLTWETSRIFFISVEENQKQIFRWEDQEIYYFTMALKDFGKNYEYISKIIQTKQVCL